MCLVILWNPGPPISTRTETLLPSPQLFRSVQVAGSVGEAVGIAFRGSAIGTDQNPSLQPESALEQREVARVDRRPQQIEIGVAGVAPAVGVGVQLPAGDRKSTRLNSSH